MIKIRKSLVAIMASLLCGTAFADCDIDISIADITKGDVVPYAINNKLEAKLAQALGKAGMVVAPYDSQFFVAGRFDDAYNDITGGPSQKVYVKTTLTLYIGDANDQKIFASESFELSGVGSSDQQAYTKALNKISASNLQLQDFFEKGKQRIIDFYDSNYRQILNKAQQAISSRNFGEALYYATSIPSCSRGYNEANAMVASIQNQNMNYESQGLLAKAKAAWAADPTADGAAEAHKYLSQIDPESSAWSEGQKLAADISKTVKTQWEFENVTKYKDQVSLEKQRIAAAKEAAVAWAKSRPKTVNRYVFVDRHYHRY